MENCRNQNGIQINKRNYIDCVRGVAVFLMVWGHAIQCGNGQLYISEQSYYSDPLFRAIYSFHMPLFAILAGYLLSSSLSTKSSLEVMKNRIISLGLPILTWGTIDFVIAFLAGEKSTGLFAVIKLGFYSIIGSLWFLWAILLCTILVVLNQRFFSNSLYGHALITAVCLFIPDRFNLGFAKFLYPFFLGGYYWNYYNKIIFSYIKRKEPAIIFLVTIAISWGVMLLGFSTDKFIYITGFSIIGKPSILLQLYIDVYRVLIGFLGSGVVLLLFWIVYKFFGVKNISILSILGKNSLGVYIFDIYLSNYLLKLLFADSNPSIIRTFCVSIVMSGMCVVISRVISKSKLLNKLMLGGR